MANERNDQRKANFNWKINTNPDGTTPQLDAHLAVLMDIRDQLTYLNALLHCSNFIGIPTTLREIRRAVNRIPARNKKKKKLNGYNKQK